ncbi:hypothetical protein F4677DRAFT_190108 [Hypoxylon crocopeplum]|nr:hypothetical protein F4677DRAFT_190108 [Hypoxylon crocopeplum]
MLWWTLIVPITGVLAVPSPQDPSPSPSSSTTKPNPTACGRIGRGISQQLASSPGATPIIPASVAFDCLSTVPNRPEPAQKLIDSLKAFMQWQSTLAWLKAPPQSYGLPPVDILGGLDDISKTAAAGKYASEYEFQLAILQLVSKAHDGHFLFIPDIFKVFTFTNPLASDIVSAAANGTSLPKLYHLDDLKSKTKDKPVAITKINGVNATTFLMDLNSLFGFTQDVDAQWNQLMPIYASPFGNNPLAFFQAYLGPNVTLTLEDGTTQSNQSQALLSTGINFSKIVTGDDFYDAFCNPDKAPKPTARSLATPRRPKPSRLVRRDPALTDYPPFVVKNSKEGTAMGFFLDGTGFDDVAVLAISSFLEEDNRQYLPGFQSAVEKFLKQSRAAGKKRLVIDLTANGGGSIAAGFELFAQLFPGVDPFNANDIRLTDGLVNISNILNSLPIQDQKSVLATSALVENLSPLDLVDPQGDKFSNATDIITPVTLQDDKFTAYMRQPSESGGDFFLTGTGNRTNPPPALFKPEDIVLLTDGSCGSTCTIFSYLMIFQKDIKTVAVGGLPRAGIMQSVGGVEGGQVIQFQEISAVSSVAISRVKDPAQKKQLQAGELGVLAEGYAVKRASKPELGSINFKNAFAPSNAQTPLQFLYEPANCRFFYTAPMITQPELVWKYAVNATWTDPKTFCVEGSMVPVNTSKAVDPAFQAKKDAANGDGGDPQTNKPDANPPQTNGQGGGDQNNGQGGDAQPNAPADKPEDKDDNPNAASGRLLEQGGMQVASLLMAVSIMMLCM